MWIFTETGFVSAVRKNDRPEVLTVRSRDRESLDSVTSATATGIHHSRHGDYPYRAFVGSEAFAAWVADSAMDIDYDNFKSRVTHTRGGHYTRALHDVWVAMLATEDAQSRSESA